MRSFRQRPVGWQNDNYRHYLAAKYGSSRKYFMPFVEKTTVPIIDTPEEYHSIREKSIVKMSPDEFLRLSKRTSEESAMRQSDSSSAKRLFEQSQEEYEKSVREERKVERVKQGLKEGKDIPMGYIEYDAERNIPLEHEGRHRAMAARELGMAEIPVALVRQRKFVKTGLMRGNWEYGEDEVDDNKVLPFKYKSEKSEKSIHRFIPTYVESKINHLAYSEPVDKPDSGKVINVGSKIGTKFVQFVYFRPVAFGVRQNK